ncbi:MAG: hypothetical protein ACM30H_07000 [Clostridia bacterium]
MRNGAKLLLACLLVSAPAFAQAPRDDDVRGSARPGSVDGSRPSDGAIQGGSILPGESAGQPAAGRGPTTPQDHPAQRCEQLSGTLREQCLLDAQRASGGGRAADPVTSGSASGRSAPPIDPPPQTPR